MSTAIFIGSLTIATAIYPEMDWTPHEDLISKFFIAFVIYDLLNLRN